MLMHDDLLNDKIFKNKIPNTVKIDDKDNTNILRFYFTFLDRRKTLVFQIWNNTFWNYGIKYFEEIIEKKSISGSLQENIGKELKILNNQEKWNNFVNFINILLDLKLIIRDGDSSRLWHYTTLDKFLNILKSGEIWFRNINFHNDCNEKNGLVSFGYEQDDIKKIFEHLNVYTFSTTDYYDDLGMWVLYLTGISYETYSYPHFLSNRETDKNNHKTCEEIKNMGVCFSINKFYLISFMFEKFNGNKGNDFNTIADDNFIFSQNVSFCKVKYEKITWDKFTETVRIYLKYAKSKSKFVDENKIKILASLARKNNWYRFEQEYRFTILNALDKNGNKLEQWFKLRGLNINELIKCVYISPYCKKCFCNLNCEKECCVNQMMKVCEKHNIKIKPSTIQFRKNSSYFMKGGE